MQNWNQSGQLERARSIAGEVDELRGELARERAARVRSEAANQYGIDPGLLADLPDDPELIEKMAARFADQPRRVDNANGVPFPPSNQTDAALSADEAQKRRWAAQARSNHLRRDMDPVDREMAFSAFFADGWNAHMAERKRAKGGRQ